MNVIPADSVRVFAADMRNCLQTIRATLDLVRMKAATEPDVDAALTVADRQIDALGKLTEKLSELFVAVPD